MEKLDIQRLHRVHAIYPYTPRRQGKTTYCLDSLLRASQTGAYKSLCYITNTMKSAQDSFYRFLEFLDSQNESYEVVCNFQVNVCGCTVNFKSNSTDKVGKTVWNSISVGYGGYIGDFSYD